MRSCGLFAAGALFLFHSHAHSVTDTWMTEPHQSETQQALAEVLERGSADETFQYGMFLVIHARDAADFGYAETLLRAAANQAHVGAQHYLGLFLMDDGAPENRLQEGLYWLGSAASLGDEIAPLVLGQIFMEGLYGISPDRCLAMDWFEAAALDGVYLPKELVKDFSEEELRDC